MQRASQSAAATVNNPEEAQASAKKRIYKGKNAYMCYKDEVFKKLMDENKGK